MAEQAEKRGLRRRADKLRFIAWANLLVCIGVGLFSDFGEAIWRWTAALTWSLALLAVCYARAGHMDKEGPVHRRQ
jgi:hypothetical protein